ncbi:hypothetical protein BH10ACT1_BH10ACT1_42800 [soil metagenome]
MNQPRRNQGRRRRSNKPKVVDVWRPVPRLADPEPIVTSSDPSALVRSLGNPPLPGQGAVAGHYLAAVVERSSSVAAALAGAYGLLAETASD